MVKDAPRHTVAPPTSPTYAVGSGAGTKADLPASRDPLYTWQYNVRWAAHRLRARCTTTCNRVAARRMGAQVTDRVGVRDRTATATSSAATSISSCSHTRIGSHPARVSRSSVSLSRRLLPSIFSLHQSALALGHVACSSQPCQKQPLTKTATLAPGKMMSACLLMLGSGRRCIRKRRPCRCNADLRARSGPVSLRRWRCIRPLTPGEEGTTVWDDASLSDMSGAYATKRAATHHPEARRASRPDDPRRAT